MLRLRRSKDNSLLEKKEKIPLKTRLKKIGPAIVNAIKQMIFGVKFIILLVFTFFEFIFQRLSRKTLANPKSIRAGLISFIHKPFTKVYKFVLSVLEKPGREEIMTSDLIFLALENLSAKKSRTYVTIGGMAIGFGFVVLLLSIGYGFERLVVSSVATLSEMRQINVMTSQGSPLTFNDEVITDISNVEGVSYVIPIVTSVSKVTYNNAVSDVIVYGVPDEYFEQSGLRPIEGELYSDRVSPVTEKVFEKDESRGVVAGVSTTIISNSSYNTDLSSVKYSIEPLIWKPVYEGPNTSSRIIGYTKRESGLQEASEVWGYTYDHFGNDLTGLDLSGEEYRPWIKDDFYIWKQEICKVEDFDCVEGNYVVEKEVERQKVVEGYISESNVSVERYEIQKGSAVELYNGKIIDEIEFQLNPNEIVRVHFDPEVDAHAVSLQTDETTAYSGKLVYGDYYENEEGYITRSSNGTPFGYWIKSEITVWGDENCDGVCDFYYDTDVEGVGIYLEETKLVSYFRLMDVEISELEDKSIFTKTNEVLGAQSSLGVSSTDEGYIDINDLVEADDSFDWATISAEIGAVEEVEKDIKSLPEGSQKIVVVNTSMLSLLGIDPNDADTVTFDANFIFDSKLFNKSNYIVESEIAQFEVLGVVSDGNPPTFYVPLSDIRVDGMSNVSELKVILDDQNDVATVREYIESTGFHTHSVVDTVDQISSLFSALRIALLVLGLIALGVASLGMFNTLTVSLMEKTREVGLLKTMGMKASEVKVLFLAESIIMSFFGGLMGLLIGFLIGKTLSILISVLSISQGQGVLDVTYIPYALAISIVLISSIVGVITGWYPAKRATQVSALNALRYE